MKLPPEPLTQPEVLAILNRMSARSFTGTRNRALVVVLWRAGLRISEALALKPADVDTAAGTIRVLHGKGDKCRTVGIDATSCTYLELWLRHREKRGLNGYRPFFCTGQGLAMDGRYVRNMLKRVAADAGVEKRVHPHGFRHTHAHELSMENVPVAVIQKQLGHANLRTTAVYLDHVSPREVVEVMQGRAW